MSGTDEKDAGVGKVDPYHAHVQSMIEITQAHVAMMSNEARWRKVRTVIFALIIMMPTLMYVWVAIKATGDQDAYGADTGDGYAAMVRIEGPIEPGGEWSARKIGASLEKAFRDEEAKGVVLAINSPGGSPVQASIINRRIEELKEQYGKEVVAVGADYMTSGAYMIAVAADMVYADSSSITGSIGVIMQKVAYAGIADRLGIERRVYTAGQWKDRFDPWRPESEADQEKAALLLGRLHEEFIAIVEEDRGAKLNGVDRELIYSGDFWTGTEALDLGLIDGLGDVKQAIRTHWKVSFVKDYSPSSPFDSLFKKMRGSVASVLLGPSYGFEFY